jgi:2-polyprenyl-3-methyl-5-hydroxy-6-metoxy-1,4-benzoquinol methylase
MAIILPPFDARIPVWDIQDLQERNCPICNTTISSIDYLRPDGLTVRRCRKCNTFFVAPAPSSQQISFFYSSYDENHRRAVNISPEELAKTYQGISPMDDFRILELSSYISFKDLKVLDIGFGRARLLYCLKKLGAIPYGVDIDEKAINFAKALDIQNVTQGTIADINRDIQYDLITMIDFIEHPLDPFYILNKASDLLAPNGLLLLWTPNGNTADNEDAPILFRVDLEHMQYLTPESCQFLANQLKMRVIHLESIGFPDLFKINSSLSKDSNVKIELKKVIRSIPGFAIINNLRQKVINRKSADARKGNYHLFCIMQKYG